MHATGEARHMQPTRRDPACMHMPAGPHASAGIILLLQLEQQSAPARWVPASCGACAALLCCAVQAASTDGSLMDEESLGHWEGLLARHATQRFGIVFVSAAGLLLTAGKVPAFGM